MNKKNTIKVWDILVRIFHWSLVVSFAIAYFTQEEDNVLHIYSGYIVLGLVSFRLIWGVVGTKYARFSNFIYSPQKVLEYSKSLLNNNPKHYTGHNPLGGWMIIALLLSLFVVTLSGLKVYAIEENKGLFSESMPSLINNAYADSEEEEDEHKSRSNEQEEEFWEEIHEVSTNIVLLLIFLHIVGVLVAAKLHKENLVSAMITGNKKL